MGDEVEQDKTFAADGRQGAGCALLLLKCSHGSTVEFDSHHPDRVRPSYRSGRQRLGEKLRAAGVTSPASQYLKQR